MTYDMNTMCTLTFHLEKKAMHTDAYIKNVSLLKYVAIVFMKRTYVCLSWIG